MSKQCKIIEDLLPLYHDGVCSEESRQMIEEHLAQCAQCRSLLSKIDQELAAPAEAEDVKLLEGIGRAVRKVRKKALATGAAIVLAVVLLLFAGVSAWWYGHEYRYYSAFAEGQTAVTVVESTKLGTKSEEMYTWSDDTYQYEVVVPDFLDMGGFVGMSRLDNSASQTVELAITRWENEKYIFHVFVNDAEKIRYFIVDSELNLHGNYTKEQLEAKQAELAECKDTVRAIINDALAKWTFMDNTQG